MATDDSNGVIPPTNEINENDLILIWLQTNIPLPDNNWVFKWWKNEINSGARSVEGYIKFLEDKDITPILKLHGLYTPTEFTQDATSELSHYSDVHSSNNHGSFPENKEDSVLYQYWNWHNTVVLNPNSGNSSLTWRRIATDHDASSEYDLFRFIKSFNNCRSIIISVHGGINIPRNSDLYKQTVLFCMQLAKDGFTIINNGEPGLSEASSLGVLLSNYSAGSVDIAIQMLNSAPTYDVNNLKPWYDAQKTVLESYPNTADLRNKSIAILFYSVPSCLNIVSSSFCILTVCKCGHFTPESASTDSTRH